MLPSEWQIARRGVDAKLLTDESLHKLDRSVQDPPSSEADAAAMLVREGLLTRYQAKLLMRGTTKGLFLGPYKVLAAIKENEYCRYFSAQHTDSGEQSILCVLRHDQPDPELANHFAKKVKLKQLPEMPPGVPSKVCRYGNTQVAVLSAVAKTKSPPKPVKSPNETTAGFQEQSTVDDLPVMDFGTDPFLTTPTSAADVTTLLEDKLDTISVLDDMPADAPEDEPIVSDPEMGTVKTTGYELKRPKKKAKKKQWRPGPKTILTVLGFMIFVVLVMILRTHILQNGL